MICHDLKFIFIHFPRTAGSSIENALKGIDWEWVDLYSKHVPADYYKEKYPDAWKNYYKFSLVRNPFDWLVSYHTEFVSSLGIRFEDFVVALTKDAALRQFYDHEGMSAIMSENLDSSVDVLKFEDISSSFDTVLKHLDVDGYRSSVPFYRARLMLQNTLKKNRLLQIYNRIFGCVGSFELKHFRKNAKRKKDYREYFNSDLRAKVENTWASDLEVFKYHF